jgi:hypothetical protein
MNSTIERRSLLVRQSDLLSTTIGGDLVILNGATDTFIGLDEIGRHVWELLETPRRVDDICDRLASCYAGDRDVIDRDVMAFLGELCAEDLVRLVTP